MKALPWILFGAYVLLTSIWRFLREDQTLGLLRHDRDVAVAQRDRYLARLGDLMGAHVDPHDPWVPGNPDGAAREVQRWQDRARAALEAFRVVDAQRAAAEDRVAALEAEIAGMAGTKAARDASGRETDHDDLSVWHVTQIHVSGQDATFEIKWRSQLSVAPASPTAPEIEPGSDGEGSAER